MLTINYMDFTCEKINVEKYCSREIDKYNLVDLRNSMTVLFQDTGSAFNTYTGLLICDEPSNHLDPKIESEIYNTMGQMMKSKIFLRYLID